MSNLSEGFNCLSFGGGAQTNEFISLKNLSLWMAFQESSQQITLYNGHFDFENIDFVVL